MNDSTAANDAPDWGALLARVAENDDKAAFRAIYQHFAPRIKAYAINQGFSQHAEVLVQEVMPNCQTDAKSVFVFTVKHVLQHCQMDT